MRVAIALGGWLNSSVVSLLLVVSMKIQFAESVLGVRFLASADWVKQAIAFEVYFSEPIDGVIIPVTGLCSEGERKIWVFSLQKRISCVKIRISLHSTHNNYPQ